MIFLTTNYTTSIYMSSSPVVDGEVVTWFRVIILPSKHFI